MKNLFLTILLFPLCALEVQSQNVATGEYFIDIDPGLGNGVPVLFSSDDSVTVDFDVLAQGLNDGYHYLYIRVKDDNDRWGHYRKQRFYVYQSAPVINNDSVFLVQAEYWIDSIPVLGTGSVISLPSDTFLYYNDSISGLQLDTGKHIVSVRVKDSNGFWSFVKTDTTKTENYEIDVIVDAPPLIRSGQEYKYTITVRNRGSEVVLDKLLLLMSTDEYLAELATGIVIIDSIELFPTMPVVSFFEPTENYIILWIKEIPSQQELVFDIYLTPQTISGTEFNVSFDLTGVVESDIEFFYSETGDKYLESGLVFNTQLDAMRLLIGQGTLPWIADSTLYAKVKDWYYNHDGLLGQYESMNNLNKMILSAIFDTLIDQSLMDTINRTFLSTLNTKFYEFDSDEDTDSLMSSDADLREGSCQSCPILCPSEISSAPLTPITSFYFTSYGCFERCKCTCDTTTAIPVSVWQAKTEKHGGHDISLDKNYATPDEIKKWNAGEYEIHAVYSGTVEKAGYNKFNGNYVKIKTTDCFGNTFYTAYLHMQKFPFLGQGTPVEAGDVVGTAGASGAAAGRHLHIEFQTENGKSIDPSCFINDSDKFGYKPKAGVAKVDLPCLPLINDECRTETYDLCYEDEIKIQRKCPYSAINRECTFPPDVVSIDPNDKTGNPGSGLQRFIQYTDTLHYGIFFENIDSATGAAQVIELIDTLDLSKVDASTFKLESVVVGEMLMLFKDSQIVHHVDTLFMTEPINGTFVRVVADFDSLTGILNYSLVSLDTATLLPVTDPTAGFLPPDTSNFHGNGFVSFKVLPVETIPDNTVIENRASIIFDTNLPILTGTWFNTIDRSSPTSSVNALPGVTSDTTFIVSWTANDGGSGVSNVDVYVKVNNDTSYTKWLSHTLASSDTFIGEWDSTYHFYSIAYDSLGIVEIKEPLDEATTTITYGTVISYTSSSISLIVYPNPTSGNLTIEVRLDEEIDDATVEILNLLNQKVAVIQLERTGNKYMKKEIYLSGQPDGVYIIRLRAEEQSVTKKFVLATD